jgi:rhamnosyltransferase
VPYNEILPGVEDREWAKCVQKLGYYICYEPAAAVFHSHNESCLQICRRSYREWYGHVGISPAFQVPLYRFIQSWKRDVLLDWRYVLANRESVYWLLMSPGYRFFQYMGAYFGQLKAKLQKSTARATARKKG